MKTFTQLYLAFFAALFMVFLLTFIGNGISNAENPELSKAVFFVS